MLQIPTSLCGSWRDRGRDKFPTIRHVLGFFPTVQAPAARGGIHSWKGITQLKTHGLLCSSNAWHFRRKNHSRRKKEINSIKKKKKKEPSSIPKLYLIAYLTVTVDIELGDNTSLSFPQAVKPNYKSLHEGVETFGEWQMCLDAG